jgi:hypothetical protein
MVERARRGGGVARMFMEQPERIAAAWRRARFAEVSREEPPPSNQLDGVAAPFIRELGRSLGGTEGSPWSRTRAVLRLSPGRGEEALRQEFEALRQCLLDAVAAQGGSEAERLLVERAMDEAEASAVAQLGRLGNPLAPRPRVPFAGLVVQVFERPPSTRSRHLPKDGQLAMH